MRRDHGGDVRFNATDNDACFVSGIRLPGQPVLSAVQVLHPASVHTRLMSSAMNIRGLGTFLNPADNAGPPRWTARLTNGDG